MQGPPYRPPFNTQPKLTWAKKQRYEGLNPDGSLKANVCFMCGGGDHRGFASRWPRDMPACTDERWQNGVWQG